MKIKRLVLAILIFSLAISGCDSSSAYTKAYVENAQLILKKNNLVGVVEMVRDGSIEDYAVYRLIVTSDDYAKLPYAEQRSILLELDKLWDMQGKIIVIEKVISQGNSFSFYDGEIEKDGEVYQPTLIPFVMPKGDFSLSWNTYSSLYNSLGGILTITRQGNAYSQTVVYTDGSCGTSKLSAATEGGVIKFTDVPDNPFGDYMTIEDDGSLAFYDNQGIVYAVPRHDPAQAPIPDCVKPMAISNEELEVSISVKSIETNGVDEVEIKVTTNLPDGMELMLDFKGPNGYWSQADVTVAGGEMRMVFGWRSNIVPGAYTLVITSPWFSVQPALVRAALGEHGKKMSGDFVTFDPSFNENSLEFRSTIDIK